MNLKHSLLIATSALIACAASPAIATKTLRVVIPRRSEMTPVQRLNREGVDAVLKHRYENAEGLFYKAYLYDPADPFTLNNLGYVSELQGQVDRAEKFYKLAAEQGCDALIDRSSVKGLDGKPMIDALGTLKNNPMRINRLNVLSMELLSQDRGFEAETLLNEALAIEPQNPFTLNNLGVADEATGDLESALRHYDEAAAAHSKELVVVTLRRSWRGKPVSEMAADSAKNLRKRMQTMTLSEVRAGMLAVRGVSATNQNDWSTAKQDFEQAYRLDPQNAFALNNLGYVAEREGDFETAKSFYARARNAYNSGARIGLATQTSAQGQPLAAVAEDSHQGMDAQLAIYSLEHRQHQTSFELKRRTNDTTESPAPKDPSTEVSHPVDTPSPAPQQ